MEYSTSQEKIDDLKSNFRNMTKKQLNGLFIDIYKELNRRWRK